LSNSPAKEPLPDRGRIAGIDFGTVRLGIAIADLEVGIATGYENYTRRSRDLDAQYFRKLVGEERIIRFVVSLPVHLDGRESEKSRQAREFGAWLAEVTGVPVVYFDERFTSAQAEQILTGAELTKKQRKARLDMLSAQIMLSAYLESPDRQEEGAAPLDDPQQEKPQ